MPVVINGSTGISGVDGSAGTPAFQGSDANTGIRFGTDVVSLVTGGSDRLYINSSGNLGIGTSSPVSLLHVGGGSSGITQLTLQGGSVGGDYGILSIQNGSTARGRLVSDAAVDALRIDTAGSAAGKIQFYTGSGYTHAVTIDASQRLGIGITSPTFPFHVRQTAGGTLVNITNDSDADFQITCSSGVATVGPTVGQLAFRTNATERARIDSSGRLLVGTSSGTAAFTLIGSEDQRLTNASIENVRKKAISHRFVNLSTTDVAMTETLEKNAGMVVVFLQNKDADQATFMFTTGREDAIAHRYSLVTGSAANCTVSLSTNVFSISGMGDGRTYTLTMSTGALGSAPTLRASSLATGDTDIIMYAVLAF